MTDRKTVITLPERIEGMNRALRVPELARLLGMSRQQIYNLVSSGHIAAYRIGGAIRLDSATVAQWLRKSAA